MKRTISLLLVIAMLAACVTALAAGPMPGGHGGMPGGAAAEPFEYDEAAQAKVYEFNGLTITGVEYVDASKTDSQLVTTITKINYEYNSEAGSIDVDAEKFNAIMTVDGAHEDIKPGTYEGTVVIELINKMGAESGFSKFDGAGVVMTYYNTAAAVVAENKLQTGYSASHALIGGETTDTESKGVKFDSNGSFFSGYYVTDSAYTISDLQMSLQGYGGDDFQGWGAGIVVTNNGNLTLNDSIIATKGVIRTGIWVGGTDSRLTATDVIVTAYNDGAAVAYSLEDNYAVPMMEKVPFALGLSGNIRATNVLGSGSAEYINSIVVSDVWGALSTDSGRAGTEALIVRDTLSGIGTLELAQEGKEYTATKTVNDVTYGFTVGTPETKSAGYVVYADAGVRDSFYGVQFYAPDYIGIMASGTSNMHFDENCYGYSGRAGFLIHQNQGTAENGGGLYIKGGKYDVEDQFILVKGGSINGSYTKTNVEVDGAEVDIFGDNAQSGVFFQLMQNDDAGSPGATEYTIDDLTYAEILAAKPDKTVDPTVGTFANMTINGDIYNSMSRSKQALVVNLDNVKMNGKVSSAYQYHVDENGETVNDKVIESVTCFDTAWNTDYLYMGRIVNVPTPAVNNAVNLTLKNGTVWTVEGVNYLSKLVIDETSSIVAEDLHISVNGKEVELKAGTYEGAIIVANGEIPVSFIDVVDGAWFHEYVMALVDKGVVSGYPDGTYKPEGEVTYGEALKLVVLAAGLPEQAATAAHWAGGYLNLAVSEGIFEADIDLNAAINRADVAKIAAVLLKYEAKEASPFADTDDKYAVALYEAGIIDGYLAEDGTRTYDPEATIKRSEIAKIIYVMMGLDEAPAEEAPAPEAPADEAPVAPPAEGAAPPETPPAE